MAKFVGESQTAGAMGDNDKLRGQLDAYTAEECRGSDGAFPDRGPLCGECNTRIPQFAELSEADEARVRELIQRHQVIEAIKALQEATGCPIRWAKIWVLHEGRPRPEFSGPPCPNCGKPLRTPKARQCAHCKADWHTNP